MRETFRMQSVQSPIIPGMTFGIEGGCCLRVAYGALQKSTAEEGIGRLVKGLKKIYKPEA